jgi:hypothetical protein
MASPRDGEYKPGETNPEVAARWARALELRKAGASFQQIADQLGYAGPSGAYQAVMSALDATLREPGESVRTLELERLDRMTLGLWQGAIAGEYQAVDRVLKIMDRRARLLGLDVLPAAEPRPASADPSDADPEAVKVALRAYLQATRKPEPTPDADA